MRVHIKAPVAVAGRARRVTTVAVIAAVLFGAVGAAPTAVQATPSVRTTGRVLAVAQLPGPVEVVTDGPSDMQFVTITINPHGNGGWHSHNGHVLVSVASGVATLYDGDDPYCQPHRYPAGAGFAEHAQHVHIIRNEGHEPLRLFVVTVVGRGVSPVIDQPRPGNCRF